MTSIPAKPFGIGQAAARDSRRSWIEVAVIYPDSGVASVNQLVVPAGRAASLLPDLGERDERVLHPTVAKHDLHDERHEERN